jgi:hypothetical protein
MRSFLNRTPLGVSLEPVLIVHTFTHTSILNSVPHVKSREYEFGLARNNSHSSFGNSAGLGLIKNGWNVTRDKNNPKPRNYENA